MMLRLQVRPPAGQPFDFQHAGPVIRVGRDPAVELSVSDDNVSWHHAAVELANGAAKLSDLGSTNGTYVNDAPVSAARALKIGDRVRLGREGPVLVVQAMPVSKPAKSAKPAPPAEMSATRKLLIHTTERQKATTYALLAVGVLLVLFVGLWLVGLTSRQNQLGTTVADLGEKTSENSDKIRSVQIVLAELADRVTKMAGELTKFGETLSDVKRTQKDEFAKLERSARDEAVKLDRLDREQKRTVEKLGTMAELIQKAQVPPEKGAIQPAQAAPPGDGSEIPFTVGKKIGIRVKNAAVADPHCGVLVRVTPQEIVIDNGLTKDRTFSLKEVQALYTDEGAYRFDKNTGKFVSAMVHYRYNQVNRAWEQIKAAEGSLFDSTWGTAKGTREYRILVSRTDDGQPAMSLPVGEGSTVVTADEFPLIVTNLGHYEYVDSDGRYKFVDNAALAQARADKKQEFWDNYDKKNRERQVENYKLQTDRIRALRPLYGRYWWHWAW